MADERTWPRAAALLVITLILSVSSAGVLVAVPFRVEQPYTHFWRAERPNVRSGHLLVLAVDQPRPPGIIAAVIAAHIQNDGLITSPRYRGHGGHPLLFSARLRDELQAITEEKQGVREVVQAHLAEVNEVKIDDPVVRLDINSPEEYEEARERYGGNDD